ncbi:MAG: alpha/beta hydrolase [Pseudomonadota bacterium]
MKFLTNAEEGGTMQVAMRGEGTPVLLFIHGFASGAEDWDAQAGYFAGAHHCAAVTLRGHGGSARGDGALSIEAFADDCAALIEREEWTNVITVGHSMGTRIAAETAVRAAGAVKGVVLVDGSNMAQSGRRAALESFDDALGRAGFEAFAKSLFEAMFFDDQHGAIAEQLVARATRFDPAYGQELYRNMVRWDADRFEDVMAAVHQPMLMIQGTTRGPDGIRRPLEEDERGAFENLILAIKPDVEVYALPGHGHFVTYEAPDAVNRAIANWMDGNGLR